MSYNSTRRELISKSSLVAGMGCFAGCTNLISQEDNGEYPTREFVLLNPYPAGGGTDVYFSRIADSLSSELGVDVRQEYRPGANSAIAMREIYNTDDHHKVTWQDIPLQTLTQFNLDNPGFDIREFTSIMSISSLPANLFVAKDSPYNNFNELKKAYEIGEISTFGGIGSGNSWHLTAWAMRNEWDLQWEEYVSYEGGGPMISAVLRGEVPVGIVTAVPLSPYVIENKLDVVLTLGNESPAAFPQMVTTPEDLNLETDKIRSTGVINYSIWGPPVLTENEQSILEESFINTFRSKELQNWAEETGNPINPAGSGQASKKLENSFELRQIYNKFQEQTRK